MEGKVDYALYETFPRVGRGSEAAEGPDVPPSLPTVNAGLLAVSTTRPTLRYSRAGSAATASRPIAGGWSTSTLVTRAGAVGGFLPMVVSPSRRSGTSADPKVYHRHFDDGDEFGTAWAPGARATIGKVWPARVAAATSTPPRRRRRPGPSLGNRVRLLPPRRHRRDTVTPPPRHRRDTC